LPNYLGGLLALLAVGLVVVGDALAELFGLPRDDVEVTELLLAALDVLVLLAQVLDHLLVGVADLLLLVLLVPLALG